MQAFNWNDTERAHYRQFFALMGDHLDEKTSRLLGVAMGMTFGEGSHTAIREITGLSPRGVLPAGRTDPPPRRWPETHDRDLSRSGSVPVETRRAGYPWRSGITAALDDQQHQGEPRRVRMVDGGAAEHPV